MRSPLVHIYHRYKNLDGTQHSVNGKTSWPHCWVDLPDDCDEEYDLDDAEWEALKNAMVTCLLCLLR